MKKNKIIIIFSSLAAFVLIECFLILPLQISKLKNTSKDLTQLSSKLENLKEDMKNKEKFIEEKDSFQKKLRNIQGRFLPKEAASIIMSEINNLSKDMDLDILSVKPQDLEEISKTKKATFYYLPVGLKMFANYHRLGVFLNRLENLGLALRVKELEITGEFPDIKVYLVICGTVKE